MSELQESLVREQTMLLLSRNWYKQHMLKKIIKRYLKCLDLK